MRMTTSLLPTRCYDQNIFTYIFYPTPKQQMPKVQAYGFSKFLVYQGKKAVYHFCHSNVWTCKFAHEVETLASRQLTCQMVVVVLCYSFLTRLTSFRQKLVNLTSFSAVNLSNEVETFVVQPSEHLIVCSMAEYFPSFNRTLFPCDSFLYGWKNFPSTQCHEEHHLYWMGIWKGVLNNHFL